MSMYAPISTMHRNLKCTLEKKKKKAAKTAWWKFILADLYLYMLEIPSIKSYK